jgi:hypothetical protein
VCVRACWVRARVVLGGGAGVWDPALPPTFVLHVRLDPELAEGAHARPASAGTARLVLRRQEARGGYRDAEEVRAPPPTPFLTVGR